MSAIGQQAILKSLFQSLSSDSILIGMVPGIHDHTPSGAVYPYVRIAAAQAEDWSTSTTEGSAHALVLEVFSREAGRKECLAILERVGVVLHRQDIDVEGHALVQLRVEGASTELQADGISYRGTLRLRALLETN